MRKDDPNLYHRRMRRVDLLVEARRHAGGGVGPARGEHLHRLGSQDSNAGWTSPALRPSRSKLPRSRLAVLDAPTVQPRDLRLVDPLFASSQEPAIEPRRGCIIVNLPPTRAIVTRDRCYFIPSDGVDEELRTLADRVLCSASAAAAAEAAAEAAAIAAAEAAEDAKYGNSSDTPTAADIPDLPSPRPGAGAAAAGQAPEGLLRSVAGSKQAGAVKAGRAVPAPASAGAPPLQQLPSSRPAETLPWELHALEALLLTVTARLRRDFGNLAPRAHSASAAMARGGEEDAAQAAARCSSWLCCGRSSRTSGCSSCCGQKTLPDGIGSRLAAEATRRSPVGGIGMIAGMSAIRRELASLQERGRALSHCLESVLESPSAMARLDLTAVETARCKEVERRAAEHHSAQAEARFAMRRRGGHHRATSSALLSPSPSATAAGQDKWVGPDGSVWVRARRGSHPDDTSEGAMSAESASTAAPASGAHIAVASSGRGKQGVRSGFGHRSQHSRGASRVGDRSASAPVREADVEDEDEDEEGEEEEQTELGEHEDEEGAGSQPDAASAGPGAEASRRDVTLLPRTPERHIAGAGPHDSDDEDDDMPELVLQEEEAGDDMAAAALFGDAVELLIESYLGEVEAALSDARQLQNEAETSERQLSLLLSASRNALLRTDLTISVVGVCLALLSAVGGFMGMNVPNGLESASAGSDGPFAVIVAASTAGATVLAVAVLLFLQRFLRVSSD